MTNDKNNLLGQGLQSLLGAKKEEVVIPVGGVLQVSVDLIHPCSHQPRTVFDEAKLLELSESIKENGILQPLVVIKLENGQYELIAGERRLRASKLAGLETVPVIIKEETTAKDKSLLSLIENIQRADLNCIEVARGSKRIMDDFKLSQEELAKKLGVNRSSIANSLRILSLPERVIGQIEKNKISFGHAKILVSIKDEDTVIALADKVIKNDLSVAKLSALIKNILSGETEESAEKEKKAPIEKVPQMYSDLIQHIPYNVEVKNHSENEGRIMIDYRTKEDLEKILRLLKKD